MGGIKPIKVYLYDSDGSYLREFESVSAFASAFDISSNIFSHSNWNEEGIYIFKDNRVAATYKIGREGIRKYRERLESPFLGKGKKIAETVYKKTKKGEVIFYDLDNNEIARFPSPFYAIELTGIEQKYLAIPVGKKKKLGDGRGIIIEVKPYVDISSKKFKRSSRRNYFRS